MARSLFILPIALVGLIAQTQTVHATQDPQLKGSIQVDTGIVTGQVPHYLFGQFIEDEHNSIDGGLLAELLHDRKFDENDRDGNGVSEGWVPEERMANRYWELRNGRGLHDRYYIDHDTYYGGGASQAIELSGEGRNHASVYQHGLRLAKGRKYSFYAYMRAHGKGTGFVELDKVRVSSYLRRYYTIASEGPSYFRKDFPIASDRWEKYTAEFTAPEDTWEAWLRIGFEGTGTFWIDSASLMPADNIDGMRRDVVEALKPIRVSVLRYPGGCFADFYHWRDGIGPRDKRPERWSTNWHEWNSNDFGTDEYMELAGLLGYDGHITTNYASGTAQEAAEWVEYANGSIDTPLGRLRAQNGHPQAYGIKLWALGNEAPALCSSDYTGGTKLTDYVERFRQYREAMLRADPSIELMASSGGGLPEWIRDLKKATPAKRVTVSIYSGTHNGNNTICDQKTFYRTVVAEPLEFRHDLDEIIAVPGLPAHPFFALTEFNSWWLPETVDPDYRLANGLWFANVFNELLRHANHIFLAESCSLINVQGIVEVNPLGIKLTPPYFAYLLYANHIGTEVLKTNAASPAVDFNPQLEALDAIATRAADGRTVYLAVVNRALKEAVSARISLKGWQPAGSSAQVFELDGKTWDAFNPYGNSDNVNISHRTAEVTRAGLIHSFPPHSVTVLEIRGKR